MVILDPLKPVETVKTGTRIKTPPKGSIYLLRRNLI